MNEGPIQETEIKCPLEHRVSGNLLALVERGIVSARLLLIPIYIGLFVGILLYTYRFVVQVYEMVIHIFTITDGELLVGVLELVDIAMIANLIMMVSVGGYQVFVKAIDWPRGIPVPPYMKHITASTLKIKMAMSLVGVTSVHLLKTFVAADKSDTRTLIVQGAIHGAFILSMIVLAKADRLMHADDNTNDAPCVH